MVKTQNNHFLFRVDGGQHYGLGHFHRCLSLACVLRDRGHRCTFVLYGDTAMSNRATKYGFEVLALKTQGGGDHDLQYLQDAAAALGCGAVVVDSYQIGAEYLRCLRSAGLFVAVVDDLAAFPFPCNLVVNGSFSASDLPYHSETGDTHFLLGPQYAMLGPEFWSLGARRVSRTVDRVLLCLGGTDHHQLMSKLLDMLDHMPGDFMVTAVIGPFFQHQRTIAETARTCRRKVELVFAPDSLCELMLNSDLAVTAGGQTTYELAATGTPMIAFEVASNQRSGLFAFSKLGAATIIGNVSDVDFLHRIADATCRLMQQPILRAELSNLGRQLVDGRGAFYVAEALESIRLTQTA